MWLVEIQSINRLLGKQSSNSYKQGKKSIFFDPESIPETFIPQKQNECM